MTQILAALKAQSTIVADTGDIAAIKAHQPEDATTNPSLHLKASEIEAYQPLLQQALAYAKANESNSEQQVALACDYFSVL